MVYTTLNSTSYLHIYFLTTLSISKTMQHVFSPFLIATFKTLLFLDINTIVFILISSFPSKKSSHSVPFTFVCKLLDFVSPASNFLHLLLHFHILIIPAILRFLHTLQYYWKPKQSTLRIRFLHHTHTLFLLHSALPFPLHSYLHCVSLKKESQNERQGLKECNGTLNTNRSNGFQ